MEKYGSVYIWYDHKNIRFYIGSHCGVEGNVGNIDRYHNNRCKKIQIVQ